MIGTIAPVREIVIVIPDLYLPPRTEEKPSSAPARQEPSLSAGELRAAKGHSPPRDVNAIPGIEHVTRFGSREVVAGGWRD